MAGIQSLRDALMPDCTFFVHFLRIGDLVARVTMDVHVIKRCDCAPAFRQRSFGLSGVTYPKRGNNMKCRLASGCIIGILVLPAHALDIDEYQLIDLSHAYSSDSLYWPTSL